ncbi:hypothetical protein [Streptomyces sp. SLBN-31]|uniref:hypothetical protein n=1 Tax=Streptomyces sp. SLBN-31 TaxID=2768444 RepID=UPI0011547CE8|nr:hypothetical protein [Streptomyces sp. SLBN-31]TQJ91241.1 hypothetical protein FBY22_2047 [Streptomyces sp. SLBN-31]
MRSLATGTVWGRVQPRLLFGFLSSQIFDHGSADGLQTAFLVRLVPLAAAGLLTLAVLGTYPRDVATALASDRETSAGNRLGSPTHRINR